MPPFPSSLQHLPCALTHPLSCIPSPKWQNPCSFRLVHRCSTRGPFRLGLGEVPRGGEQSGVPGLRFTQEGVSQCECKFV